MTIPFVDLFRKVTDKVTARFFASAAPGPARVESVRVKKPSGERLSKTVLPNTTRSLTPSDPFRVTAGPPSSDPAARQLGPRKIQSAAGPGASRSRDLPRALAFALEPKVERAISLQLADFLDQVPADYIKPVEVIDATRCVALKASEIEKGMADHKPSISLPSLYQQLPEIFLRSVPLTDPTRISLPYAKVLEQFKNTRVRTDQVRDQSIPQLDRPIRKATLEDTERFATKIEPLETSPLPPVPVEPATAETIASAEPESVARETITSTTPKSTSSPPPLPVISLHRRQRRFPFIFRRMERVRPPLREFQPQAGRPFLPLYQRSLNWRGFHLICQLKLSIQKFDLQQREMNLRRRLMQLSKYSRQRDQQSDSHSNRSFEMCRRFN
jgi:hypothetical protein